MKKISINFNKKNIVITGASRGIGKNISSKFENLGAKVIKLNSSLFATDTSPKAASTLIGVLTDAI